MNAAAPSNQKIRVTETVARAEQPPPPAPAAPVTVHPLVWAIQLWVVASVTSLVLSAGLSQALRGAFVGAELWIIRIDHSAALTSQVAAICTALLLVYVGMLSTRAARTPMLGVGAALLGAAPTMIVFYAHRLVLPQVHGWIAALCGSGALILCATQARTNAMVRTIVALGGLTLFSIALRAGGLNGTGSALLSEIGTSLAGLLSTCTLLLTLGWHLWSQRRRPLQGALLLGASLLLFATVSGSSLPNSPLGVRLAGRSLVELAPAELLGSLAPLAFATSLLLVFSTLFARPGSLAQVICALIALGSLAPATPLVVAWLTLCGFCSVVVCWVPDAAVREHT